MSDIGVGDYVQCVDANPEAGPKPGARWMDDKAPAEGAFYWVSAAFVTHAGDEVILVGWERERASSEFGYRAGYGLWRFRKIGPGERSDLDVSKPTKVSA